MSGRITKEVFVGLSEQMAEALTVACTFSGVKPSIYGRQALLQRLVAEGFMQHPLAHLANNNSNNAKV
jgi:hypothetical protein